MSGVSSSVGAVEREISLAEGQAVQRVGNEIRRHLAEIARLFVPGTKLTIVARPPMSPNGERDMVLTDDKLEDVVRALALAMRRDGVAS